MKRKICTTLYAQALKRALILLMFAIGFTSLHAQTYTVGTSGTYTTLSAAVSAVPAGSTLEILSDQTCANIAISKNLTIRKSTTVTGDIVLNISGTGRHFTISGTNTSVTFEDLLFQGPNATSSGTALGGGIASGTANNTLSLVNCKLTGCRGANGGAVSYTIASQTVILDNTEISNCSSTSTGGGVHCAGTLTINSSTISNNIAATSGGGINCTGASAITNSAISNNMAATSGGGINCTGTSAIANSTISNNTTTSNNGGGIYAAKALTLNGVIILGNKAGWTGSGYNSTACSGGGAYATSNLILQGVIEISNNGASGSGGGIYKNTAAAPFDVSELTTLKVNSNVAKGATGGGIYTATDLDFTSAVSFISAEINGNEAKTSGGGIYANTLLGLKEATVSGNKAGYDGEAYISGVSYGGGVYANSNLILAGSVTVNGNTSGNTGGGIYKVGTGIIDASAITTLTVSGNEAKGLFTSTIGLGGGIYTTATTTDLLNGIINITNNKAKVSGGGIYTTGILNLKNVTIADNEAEATGGGIYLSTQALTIYNSTVSGNKAGQQGGGIYTATNGQGNYIRGYNLTLSDNKAGWNFINNTYSTTSYDGGGIYANGPLAFNDVLTVTNNTATGNGGGIYKKPSTIAGFDVAEVKVLTLTGNQSINGNGGGIYSTFEMLFTKQEEGTETRAVITDNNAGGSGGAIYTTADLYFAFTNDQSSVTISNNRAGQTGGAIFVNGGMLSLSKITVSENNAAGSGGAIYMAGAKAMTILKSTFSDNTSGSTGGAVFSTSSNTLQEIANCTFFKNSANTNGGAIHFNSGTASVYYCTLNGNSTTNSSNSNAIYWSASGTLNLNGNIIYGNGVDANSEVSRTAGTLTASYNIVREQTIAGTSNQTVAAGAGAAIFASVDGGNPDLAILANNGGHTLTILIKEGGLANAQIPMAEAMSFGGNSSTDQRDFNRLTANVMDVGSVQIPTQACQRTDPNPIVWYVDLNTLTPGDGMDIAHPATDLAAVLNNLCLLTGDTIKVTSATYFSTVTDPNSTFILKKGVSILGGYAPDFSEVSRDFQNNPTVLDGNAKSYHVVSVFTTVDESSQIEGVVIQNGKALGATASQTFGGGIYFYTGKLLLSNSIIKDNFSKERGGGIYVAPNGAVLTVRNSSFTGNKSGYNGTAIISMAGTSSPPAAELMKNSGGAICAEGNLELQGSLYFDNNESAGNGGSIIKGVQNNFVATLLDTLIITNSTAYVTDTDGSWGGGGIYTMINMDLFAAKKLKIHNSIAKSGQGGGIFINNKTIGRVILTVNNGNFYSCKAQGSNGDGGAIESYGATKSLVILRNCTFDNCLCTRYGGALGIGNALKLEGTIKINNSTAGTNGGGITHWNGSGGFPEYNEFDVQQLDTLIVTNCKVTASQTANFGGGGIWIQQSDLDLSPVKYVLIENNFSATEGGGIRCQSASRTLTLGNAIIRGNKSGTTNGTTFIAKSGGGVFTVGPMAIAPGAKVIVDQNMSGSDGGGIYCNVAFTADQADSLVISNNEAGKAGAGSGGGIYAKTTCTITNATVANNKAKTNGGGIYSSTTLAVKKCTFDQNSATLGGGIYATGKSTRTIFISTFSGNTATGNNGGGAIYSATAGDGIQITFSTFTSNNTLNNQAAAFYFADAAGKVLNGNIIYGNGTGDTSTEMNTLPATANYNIIRNLNLGGTNKMLPDGQLLNIFETGTLANNGGKTKTIMIKKGGPAHNFIPPSAASSW